MKMFVEDTIHIISELHSANYNTTPCDRLWQMIKIVANYQNGQNPSPPFSSGLATLQTILTILSDCFYLPFRTSYSITLRYVYLFINTFEIIYNSNECSIFYRLLNNTILISSFGIFQNSQLYKIIISDECCVVS